jgi:hypothetical protein
MSYQKPEKDFGDGPVRLQTGAISIAQLGSHSNKLHPENPQNPHHFDLQESSGSREGLR